MDLSFLKQARSFNPQDGLDLLRSGGVITMSWGAHNIVSIKEGKEVRGLAFDVNGMHFQGTIVLSVNFMDLYEVRFFKDGELVDTMTDIYVEDMINLIDEKVEKIDSYCK